LEKKGSGSEQLENGTPFGEIFNMRQEVINLEGEGTGTSRLLQRKSIRDCFAGMSQGESFSLPLKTISEGPRNIDNSMFNVGDYSNAGWHNVDMVNESEAADSAHPEHVTNTLGRSGHHWPEQTTEEVSTFQPGEVDYLLAA
jgi:hypothetical protein